MEYRLQNNISVYVGDTMTEAILFRGTAVITLTDHRREVEAIKADALDVSNQQRKQVAQLTADVNTLNQLLRDHGYGQGEIDGMAADIDLQAQVAQLLGQLEAARDRVRDLYHNAGEREQTDSVLGYRKACEDMLREPTGTVLPSWRQRFKGVEAQYLDAVMAIGHLRAAKEHVEAQVAQLGNLVAEKDERIEALTAERDAAYRHSSEQARTEAALGMELDNLLGLVGALPVVKGPVTIIKSDGMAHVMAEGEEWGHFLTRREAEIFGALLTYRATLAQAQLLKSTNSVEISSSAQPKGEQ